MSVYLCLEGVLDPRILGRERPERPSVMRGSDSYSYDDEAACLCPSFPLLCCTTITLTTTKLLHERLTHSAFPSSHPQRRHDQGPLPLPEFLS